MVGLDNLDSMILSSVGNISHRPETSVSQKSKTTLLLHTEASYTVFYWKRELSQHCPSDSSHSHFVYSSSYKLVRKIYWLIYFTWKWYSHCITFLQHIHRDGFQEKVQRHWLLCLLVTCTSTLWNDVEHLPFLLIYFPTTSCTVSPQHVIKRHEVSFLTRRIHLCLDRYQPLLIKLLLTAYLKIFCAKRSFKDWC